MGHAWGELYLWVGDSLVWGEREDNENTPIIWSWVEFLEGIGRIWPWLTLEEAYPIPILPEHPGKIDLELMKRWDEMDQSQCEDEEDLMFDFKHRHNLALLLRGINLPPVFAIREGGEMVLWSSILDYPVRVDFSEFVRVFSDFGNYLCELLRSSENPLAKLAVSRWDDRILKTFEMKNADTFGIEDPVVIELLQRGSDVVDHGAANDDLYFDNETRAAARMTVKKITSKDQAVILDTIHRVESRPTLELDQLSKEAPDVDQFAVRGWEQGYALALWFRERLNLGLGKVDPASILEGWGVGLVEIQIDPAICAVAVWGRKHGPAIILNTTSPARSSGAKGRRATLAHEICHLIYDRQRSLPVADVLGGYGPQFAEKRANAFAAEFLLPRSVAAQAVQSSQDGIIKVSTRLEKKYGVSREIVRNQIINSYDAGHIDQQVKLELYAWAREKPGFEVKDI